MPEKPNEVIEHYERHATRSKAPQDRVRALARAAQVAAAKGQAAKASAFYELALAGAPTDETLAVIERSAREGDELGLAAVESFATWLGRGFAIVADVLDPAHIVLGGGLSEDADLFLTHAVASMEENIVGSQYRPHPQIHCAELGPRAGMIGVADLARGAEDQKRT